MGKHTPGPWKVILHGNEEYPYPLSVLSEDGEKWIARNGYVSTIPNARLIASAPELLEALQKIADGRSGNCVFQDMGVLQKIARHAIAKATDKDND